VKKEVIGKLRSVLNRQAVIEDDTELLVYECDGLPLFKNKPDAVVFPESTAQVGMGSDGGCR